LTSSLTITVLKEHISHSDDRSLDCMQQSIYKEGSIKYFNLQ